MALAARLLRAAHTRPERVDFGARGSQLLSEGREQLRERAFPILGHSRTLALAARDEGVSAAHGRAELRTIVADLRQPSLGGASLVLKRFGGDVARTVLPTAAASEREGIAAVAAAADAAARLPARGAILLPREAVSAAAEAATAATAAAAAAAAASQARRAAHRRLGGVHER